MAKLIFGINQSLDGYVDRLKMFETGPSRVLFRHFIEQVGDLTGMVYGRRVYEVMCYWDDDRPDWDAEERDYAAVWRSQPKWVVSRSLKSVGPNATPVECVRQRPSTTLTFYARPIRHSFVQVRFCSPGRGLTGSLSSSAPPEPAPPPCGRRSSRAVLVCVFAP